MADEVLRGAEGQLADSQCQSNDMDEFMEKISKGPSPRYATELSAIAADQAEDILKLRRVLVRVNGHALP